MKKVWVEENDDYGLITYVNMEDVNDAMKEFSSYLNKKGRIYDMDVFKTPIPKNFIRYYFGDIDWDDERATVPEIPYKIVCTNKNVASKLYPFIHDILYFRDDMNSVACGVYQEGKVIEIKYGEW